MGRTLSLARPALLSFTTLLLLAAACDADPAADAAAGNGGTAGRSAGGHGGRASAGAGDAPNARAPEGDGGARAARGGSGGSAGTHRGGTAGTSGTFGTSGTSGVHATGGSGEMAGTGGDTAGADSGGASAGAPPEGGSSGTALDLDATVTTGIATTSTSPRPDSGALVVEADGRRLYAVESRRDIEPGPFGIPWRSTFRVAAYDDGELAWARAADQDDVVSDVVVHPSGDVTIAVLRLAPARLAYDLLRFDHDGTLLGTTTLSDPETVPDADLGDLEHPVFGMKSEHSDATEGDWVQLLPDGEGLFAALLSHVDRPSDDPLSVRLVLGLEAFDWNGSEYDERWARVVEGPHGASPAAWTYDELRWRDQAVKPYLAQDDVTGELFVGRAFNNTRCEANVDVFAEFTPEDCVLRAVNAIENERLPLAVTRFSETGERRGSVALMPDDDAGEQLAFALAAHDGELYVAGSVVRENADGSKRTYPDPSGYVDYDGYLAVYEPNGELVRQHDFNLGRGDVLAALRVTSGGVVAVGSAGWDRWQGGMSISRGADPCFAWWSLDGARAGARVLPMTDGSRHYNLHDAVVTDDSLIGMGFSDAPMTHSADGGHDEARTFGLLRLALTAP